MIGLDFRNASKHRRALFIELTVGMILKWNFQSSSGAVCSVDGATIAGADGIIPEKNLRTVFCPQIFLNTVFPLLSQPRPNLIHQLFLALLP